MRVLAAIPLAWFGVAVLLLLPGCRSSLFAPGSPESLDGSRQGFDWLSVWHALPESWDACRDPEGEETLSGDDVHWDPFPRGTARSFVCHAMSIVSLAEVQAAAPVPVFLSGPHGEGVDLHNPRQFGHYNPAFVRWFEGAVPEDAAAIVVTQPIYDHFLEPMARTFYQVYQVMEASPELVDEELERYRSAIASGARAGFYLSPSALEILDENIACAHPEGRRQYEVEPGPVLGFWLRRTLDGSRGAFVSALTRLLSTYDEDWFRGKQLPLPDPPPVLETTQPTGPSLQSVRVGSGPTQWALTHSLERGWARHLPTGRRVTLWKREDARDYVSYDMDARLVSVVGPHVTYEIITGGYSEGAAHPFAYHSYKTVSLTEPGEMHPDSGAPVGVPLKWLFHHPNTRCSGAPDADKGVCDERAADERVTKALAHDPWLEEARASSYASCIFNESDLVGTSYGFHRWVDDQVEVHLGLSHGCEVERGGFNLVSVMLTPPPSPSAGVSSDRTSSLRAELAEAEARGLLGRHLRATDDWPADPATDAKPQPPAAPVVLSPRAPERAHAHSAAECRDLGICHPERARGNHALCRATPACEKWGYCQYVVETSRHSGSETQLKTREAAARIHRGFVDMGKADADLVEHHLLEHGQDWIRDREGARFISLAQQSRSNGVFGMCLPGGDDCAASEACERFGRCVGTAYACEWRADPQGRCDVPMGTEGINPCRMFGKCTNRSERCYAMSDQDCAGDSVQPDSASEICRRHGRCVAQKRACVAQRAADCARSEGCRTDGLCCLGAGRGTCHACKAEHCQESESCEREGRCALDGGRCASAGAD